MVHPRVGFDITELKRAEEALQEERNVVSAILDTVGALVVVLDPHGRIVRFNRACERTSGFDFADVKGRYIWDLFAAPRRRAVQRRPGTVAGRQRSGRV